MARRTDPVTQYARAVVAGRIVTGRLVRLAAARHLRDLKTLKKFHFDAEAADRAIEFFNHLKHYKGEWAGQPLRLAPWQQFIVGSLLGWRRKDGTRRFREAYEEVPRKNGKSTKDAGLGILLGFFDGEPGAEVYCAATKKDQARIIFRDAKQMIQRTPALKKRLQVLVNNVNSQASSSKMEPLGADEDTLDGLNVHAALIDELHAHKNAGVVDILKTATGARRQPLIKYVTTAGFDRNSVCWRIHDYGVKVLEGIVHDETFFAFIACADEGDDWREPLTWEKANPNLGVSVSLEDLKRKCLQAQHMPTAQNAFRRLHLNEWTESHTAWIPDHIWMKGDARVDVAALAGRPCFAGLDMASNRDIAALVLLFPEDDGYFDVLPFFWVPEDGVRERSQKDRVPYDVWAAAGLIEVTSGNVTDQDFIESRIFELAGLYQILEIAFDRWGINQLVTHLQNELSGTELVAFGQGFQSMAAPCKEIERLALEGKLRHGGHPVLRWMNANVAVRQDPAGNHKIDKEKSSEKVDGMVGLAMAVGRAIVHAGLGSVYDQREPYVFSSRDDEGDKPSPETP